MPKSFQDQHGREPVAGKDYDPNATFCQDDYEYLTGTGRYSGALRAPQPPTIIKTFRMTAQDVELLEKISQAKQISASAAIRSLVRFEAGRLGINHKEN